MTDKTKQCTSHSAGRRHWYVIYTKARQESVAEENLNRQGYTTYLPQLRVTKRRQGVLQSRIEPFFPRYLFIQLNQSTDNWAPIRSTRGVASLVKVLGSPRAVPAALIESLRANEDANRVQQQAGSTWQAGDEVEIEQGPFAGYRCIFQSHRSGDRVAVLLNIIGKATVATLDSADLQIA